LGSHTWLQPDSDWSWTSTPSLCVDLGLLHRFCEHPPSLLLSRRSDCWCGDWSWGMISAGASFELGASVQGKGTQTLSLIGRRLQSHCSIKGKMGVIVVAILENKLSKNFMLTQCTTMPKFFILLRWGLENCLPRLALNNDPPDLSLQVFRITVMSSPPSPCCSFYRVPSHASVCSPLHLQHITQALALRGCSPCTFLLLGGTFMYTYAGWIVCSGITSWSIIYLVTIATTCPLTMRLSQQISIKCGEGHRIVSVSHPLESHT
jgi:hypothetical protein